MAEYSVGSSGGSFEDTRRRAEAARADIEDLNRKEDQRRATEERTAQTEQQSARTRTGLSGATRELTTALETNVGALNAETSALERNIGMMQRSLELRRQMSSTAGRGASPGAAAVSGDAGLAQIERVNAALAASTAEANRMAAAMERALSGIRVGTPFAGSPAASYLASQQRFAGVGTSETDLLRQAGYSSLARAPSEPQRPQLTQFAASTGSAEQVRAATQAEADYREQVRQNEHDLARLAATQRDSNLAFQQAGAMYADASQALSRHGALTTEFIQAFARGQVTLKEFESQMLSTIGKFGGWAIAGGAVFGVVKLLDDLKNGAVETQAAVQQLGRFIPGLGGPAGGGTGQVQAAQSTVRDISTQFNVPIKDVVDNMQVMARAFHNVADAGEATRAVLAAARLDQVPAAQAQQYLVGIAQSTGLTSGSQVTGVINSLNALQATYGGARVSQTLPALARAAPAAIASGTDMNTLEALASMGVSAGLPGNQVGTALLRSMGTFSMRPASQMTFREFGIQPQIGEYGKLIHDVMGTIDRNIQQGHPLSGPELTRLAQGLGGPLLGTRSILPLLEQEAQHPGTFAAREATTRHPRSYQEDLDAVLGTITERFKSIGIALQNFGGMLAQAGLLTPITALFDGFTTLVHVTEALLSPLLALGRVVNELPGPLKDAVAALIAFRGARALYNTTFGSAAQSFVGRLPGLSQLGPSGDRQAVEGAQARLETYLIPQARDQAEAARRAMFQATAQERGARQNVQDLSRSGAPPDVLASAIQRQQQAEERVRPGSALDQRVQETTSTLANLQGDLVVLKDKQYSFANRAAYMEQQGYVALEETVNLQDQILASKRAQMVAIRGGTAAGAAEGAAAGRAGGGAALGEAALLTGAGVAATAAAEALSRDPSAVGDLQQTSDQVRASRAGTPQVVLPPGVARPEPVTAAGMSAVTQAALDRQAAERRMPIATRAESLTGATGLGVVDRFQSATNKLADRMASVAGVGTSADYAALSSQGLGPAAVMQATGDRLRGLMGSPGLPIAGLIGTQMLGQTIGGGVGNYISGVGGSAFGGMLMMQMLGRGNPALGFAAGAALGNFQQGSGAGIGSLAGGAIGAGLGLLGGPFAGLTVPVGAALGSVAGGILGQIISPGGNQQTPQLTAGDIQNQGTITAAQAAQMAERPGRAGQMGLASLSSTLESNLNDALYSTGTNQQQGQAGVQALMKHLTAQVQLFGLQSPQGQRAQQVLGQAFVPAAIQQAVVDPSTAQQLVQTATEPANQEVQRMLQYRVAMSSGPGSGIAAANQAAAQYQQIAQPFVTASAQAQGDVADSTQQLAALRQREAGATGSQKTNLQKQVQAAQHGLDGLKQQAQAARQLSTLAQQNATLQSQAAAQAGFQADQQSIQSEGQLKVAQAGGDTLKQLQAQRDTTTKQLQSARNATNLDPRTRRNQMNQDQATLIDLHNKTIQERFGRLQAAGAVAEASTPIGDPVAQAQTHLKDLQDQYKFMQQNKSAFDPKQIQETLATVIQAKKDVATTAADYATTMQDLRTQIAQAKDYGNAVAQANDQISGALADLQVAATPQQRLEARAKLVAGQNAAYEASQQRIQEQGALAAAQAQGDPLAVASVNLQTSQSLLANARGQDNITKARADVANNLYAYDQAMFARIQTVAQVQEAQNQGDPVRVAQIALSAAQQERAQARNWEQQMQAEKDLADAQYKYSEALEQRDTALGDLAASTTVDPIRKLRDQVNAARKALADARGTSDRRAAQTNLNNLTNQLNQTYIDTTDQTIQFQLSMMEINAQQAMNQLRRLLTLPGLTKQKRQELEQQLKQIALGQYSTIYGSAANFDLAPQGANIAAPTIYDVRRAMGTHGLSRIGQPSTVNAPTATQINVYVGNQNDVPKVADAIERATGGHVRARMRAAGVRGV